MQSALQSPTGCRCWIDDQCIRNALDGFPQPIESLFRGFFIRVEPSSSQIRSQRGIHSGNLLPRRFEGQVALLLLGRKMWRRNLAVCDVRCELVFLVQLLPNGQRGGFRFFALSPLLAA